MDYVAPLGEPPGSPWRDADAATNTDGSHIAADAISHPMLEILNAIKASGQVPDGKDLTQLSKAMAKMAETAVKNSDSGGVDPASLPRFSEKDWGLGRLASDDQARAGTSRALAVSPASLKPLLNEKAPASHVHTITQITGLQAQLDARATASHTHQIGQIAGLQGQLDSKSHVSHTHQVGQIAGLQGQLDSKSHVSHTHRVGQIDGLQGQIESLKVRGNLGRSGYLVLPNGFIIQWGEAITNVHSYVDFTFPIAFPRARFGIVATHSGTDGAMVIEDWRWKDNPSRGVLVPFRYDGSRSAGRTWFVHWYAMGC